MCSGRPVFLLVDNHDHPQRASNGNEKITNILYDHLIAPLGYISHQFWCRGILLGQATPAELRLRCGGRDIWSVFAEDCSRDDRLATAFGLTKAEIHHLCITFGVPAVEKEIFASLTGHRFCDSLEERVYCTKDVLNFLRRQPSLADRTYIDCYAATREQRMNGLSRSTV